MEKEEQGVPLDGIAGGAVGIVLARMDTHPEEFFANEDKWKFIYKDYFRDAMSETEKGMIFDKIKKIRMAEFSQAVLTTLVDSHNEDREDEEDWTQYASEAKRKEWAKQERNNPAFGSAPVKREGSKVRY